MRHLARSRSRRFLLTPLLCLLVLPILNCHAALANAGDPATRPAQPPAPPSSPSQTPKLVLHVAKDGWAVDDRADVEAVLRSAARELLVYFPGATLEPVRVTGGGGPITYFDRDGDGCIRMK